MNFHITDTAADFYKHEFGLKTGEALRLFVRAGEGFFFGVEKDCCQPDDLQINCNGVTFLINENEAWFYDRKQLTYIAANDEIQLLAL